jgi:hypothetical protein
LSIEIIITTVSLFNINVFNTFILKRLGVSGWRCSILLGVDSGCELFVGAGWDELIRLLISEELLELEELLEYFSMKDPSSNI